MRSLASISLLSVSKRGPRRSYSAFRSGLSACSFSRASRHVVISSYVPSLRPGAPAAPDGAASSPRGGFAPSLPHPRRASVFASSTHAAKCRFRCEAHRQPGGCPAVARRCAPRRRSERQTGRGVCCPSPPAGRCIARSRPLQLPETCRVWRCTRTPVRPPPARGIERNISHLSYYRIYATASATAELRLRPVIDITVASAPP